jgi:hypothetical protein
LSDKKDIYSNYFSKKRSEGRKILTLISTLGWFSWLLGKVGGFII